MASPAQIARALPRFEFAIWVPTRPAEIARRHFNRLAKEALRETLVYHQKTFLPLHFKAGAANRYGYKRRKESWNRHKMKYYGSGAVDLVETGRSKFRILSGGKITIGGAAEGGKKGLEGKLTVRSDFSRKVAAQQREKYEAKKR